MRVRVTSFAHEDILDGRLFYDAQEMGLGKYFSSSVYSDIRSLTNFAGIHPHRHGYYMLVMRRFPFSASNNPQSVAKFGMRSGESNGEAASRRFYKKTAPWAISKMTADAALSRPINSGQAARTPLPLLFSRLFTP